jgi:flagellar biosynthesis/type III secretory pathway chaperone
MSMDINSLRQMIQQDKTALESLRECLGKEREYLEARNLDQMQTLIERKTQLLDEISQQVKLRANFCSDIH